jgi:serine phosphatase RsbU (regulator of sigma subunit)/pSer/pThr/pTyr-binding forkhead associated (FHA) protein
MATLLVNQGELSGQTIPLDADSLIFGRKHDPLECDIIISRAKAVSRRHMRIFRKEADHYIEDLRSHNHTYLNGNELVAGAPALLQHNDRITICKDQFEAVFLSEKDSTVEAALESNSDHHLESQPSAKLAILLEITGKLSKTLQLDRQLPEVADGLLRMFTQADRCFIILMDEDTRNLVTKVVRTRAHDDEGLEGYSRTIVLQCLSGPKAGPKLFREGDALSPGSSSVSAFHIRSVMCVPLMSGAGIPFGVIQVDTQTANKRFTEDDLRLLHGVSYQVSVAMENARMQNLLLAQEKVKNELDLAAQVQRNFLPQRLPQLPGYEFYAFYQAAREVGGDYYDFIPLSEGRLAVTLGDVAGKGMPAALLMARLSSETRSCLLSEKQPTAAISRLNDQLHPFTSPMDRFVTLLAAILDPINHTLTLVNAGHPSPLWYRRADKQFAKAVPSEDDGQSLGLDLGNRYRSYEMKLEPGDFLIVYSDGVTDAQSRAGRSFKMSGIEAVLEKFASESPRAWGERLVQAVQKHAVGGPQYDDITLLCFGRPPK